MLPAFLQPGETVLLEQRRHPLSALDAWLGILVLVVLVGLGAFLVAAFVTRAAVPYSIAITVLAALLGALAALSVWFRVATSVNLVTADRVYHAHGKLRFFLAQTTFDRVTDLHVHQSFFGRRFGFGTVGVQTAGTGVTLAGVRDPLAVKDAIEQARAAMVERLLRQHAPQARASTVRTIPADPGLARVAKQASSVSSAEPVWAGAPTLASVLANLIPTAITLLPFLFFGVLAGPASGGLSFWALPIIAVVSVIAVVAGLVTRRHTRYEVHAWGVAVSRGWLSRSRVEARYEKVTDVAVNEGVLGRVFGFGTIRINTAGGLQAPVSFQGIQHPGQVKALIDQARQDAP